MVQPGGTDRLNNLGTKRNTTEGMRPLTGRSRCTDCRTHSHDGRLRESRSGTAFGRGRFLVRELRPERRIILFRQCRKTRRTPVPEHRCGGPREDARIYLVRGTRRRDLRHRPHGKGCTDIAQHREGYRTLNSKPLSLERLLIKVSAKTEVPTTVVNFAIIICTVNILLFKHPYYSNS